MDRLIQSTTTKIATAASTLASSTTSSSTSTSTTFSTSTTTFAPSTTTEKITTTVRDYLQDSLNSINAGYNAAKEAIFDTTTTTSPTTAAAFYDETVTSPQSSGILDSVVSSVAENIKSFSDLRPDPTSNIDYNFPPIENILPHAEAYSQLSTIPPFHVNVTSCERVNIMGTIVQDSTPYLYPFIIEYSLIGAAVIYVMWKHIGRYPKYTPDEDLEHRLEVMLSRRAVALAQASSGRVDCVGASKGLFFGLLLLVGSLICFILFFVLVRHNEFQILAYYLADASHAGLMGFAILAILIGFIR